MPVPRGMGILPMCSTKELINLGGRLIHAQAVGRTAEGEELFFPGFFLFGGGGFNEREAILFSAAFPFIAPHIVVGENIGNQTHSANDQNLL